MYIRTHVRRYPLENNIFSPLSSIAYARAVGGMCEHVCAHRIETKHIQSHRKCQSAKDIEFDFKRKCNGKKKMTQTSPQIPIKLPTVTYGLPKFPVRLIR